jgi:hypothetical protein
MIDILIPTMKSCDDIEFMYYNLSKTVMKTRTHIFATCLKISASANRNIALNGCYGYDIIVMMDDDITGFYDGWLEELVKGFTDEFCMMSARLINEDGTNAYMLSENNDMDKPVVISESRELPTACIIFRKDELRFDENFIGSGFEDNDFCKQMGLKYPDKKFGINNNVKLIHKNEKKNQHGKYWEHNKKYFNEKWGTNR